ncbi:MAG: CdaR family protein, partial [Erysipelotrichaceae bacterium]|nr:CdaR family protein [Erysipelotrichaceae bacterium]
MAAPTEKKPTKVRKTTRKSRDLNKDSDYKLELANSIARNSKRVVNTYAQIENTVIYFFRWMGGIIDKFLFNQKFGKYTALLLAIVLYIAVNSDAKSANILASSGGTQLENIPVQVIVNSDAYEVSGIPDTVSAMVIGDVSDIQLVKSQTSYKVIADLSGLTEGTHQIKLTPVDFSNRLTISLNPSNVVVTIRKKTTAKFKITHEYVNLNKMDKIYALDNEPVLSTTEVLVKASQETIDQIAYVKALIDVTGVKQDFETTAQIVAYNQ